MTDIDDQISTAFPSLPKLAYPTFRRHLYVSPDGALCAIATSAHCVYVDTNGLTLPTRLSAAATAALENLKELVSSGAVTGIAFHDGDEHVTVEEIEV